MPPFRKFRGLLSRAAEDWRDAFETLFPKASRDVQRPLRIMRLERRRVLSADFALVGGSLVIDGFDASQGDSLTVVQTADEYRFVSSDGWSENAGEPPEGFSLDGQTLVADRSVIDSLPGGLRVEGADVTFSSAAVTPPSATPNVPTGGLTLTSLSVSGDLNLFSAGPINDLPGTSITVTGDATFVSRGVGGINLADTPGDSLIVGGETTFDAIDGATRLDIAVGSAGRVELGDVNAFGGQVAINERAGTRLDQIDATDFALTSAGVIDTTAGATIEVSGDASLTSTSTFNPADYNDDGVVDSLDQDVLNANFGPVATPGDPGDGNADGRVDAADYAVWRQRLGEIEGPGGITIVDAATLQVGGQATLIAQDAQGDYDILVGPDPNVQFGSLAVIGATVSIHEDLGGTADGTLLTDVDAGQFTLFSDGPITDAPDATIRVTGDAEIESTSAVTLDSPAVDFGTLGVTGLGVLVREASGTNLTGVTATTFDLASQGPIVDETGAVIAVANAAILESTGAITLDNDQVNFGTLSVTGTDVLVREASGTLLVDVMADNLDLVSAGAIEDTAGAAIAVAADASFRAGANIALADEGPLGNVLVVGGLASFEVDPGADIRVGIDPIGNRANASFASGLLNVVAPGGVVQVASISTVRLASLNLAGTLSLVSDDAIEDNAGAILTVTGDAVIAADAAVTLDNDQVNFGTLNVAGTDVLIREASGTNLAGVDAATFDLVALGPVVDDPGAVISVTGSAVIGEPGAAGDTITLDNPSVNFGDIGLFGADAILQEASGTLLSSIQVRSLDLVSAGAIEDLPDAVIAVFGQASLEAALGVTLADAGAENDVLLGLVALTTIRAGSGETISLGVDPSGTALPGEIVPDADASFRAPLLQLLTPGGLAQVSDDSNTADILPGITLAGRNEAETLLVQTTAGISDVSDASGSPGINAADIEVTGDASFRAATGIVLADGATTDNRLVVNGLARFQVDPGNDIDVGVDALGAPADAVFVPGTLSLASPGGLSRVAVDSSAVLASSNLVGNLRLNAAGAIADTTDADTEVTGAAELVADGGAADVVLGDESARFSLGAPVLFNPDEFLAIAARNVSVQADSAVNVRTSAFDPAFGGTYALSATGTIAQVGNQSDEVEPLTAERVSLASEGAVLFSDIRLTSEDDLPNLQVSAGEAVDLASDFDSDALRTRFNLDAIPSSQETSLSPAVVEADLADGSRPAQPLRVDESGNPDAGLEDVLVAGQPSRLGERAPGVGPAPTGFGVPVNIGDDYSVIVRVEGAAIVGDVEDATGAMVDNADARGLVVASTGNAFLDTTDSLEFTGRGRFDTTASVDVVALGGGVLTAVAGTTLSIDTEDGDQPDPTRRTTRLRSATGAVTNLAPGDQSGLDAAPGPRVLLDTPNEAGNAATTGLLRADLDPALDFEQRITAAVGSRGEDNLLIEVEWADVGTVRNQSAASVEAGVAPLRAGFDVADVAGSREFADLIQTPVESIETLEANTAATGLDYQDLDGEFRVVTISHNYSRAFITANPAQDAAPTTIRVFNDPAINLFDQGGERDLNSATLTVSPQIITQPAPGFFLITTPEEPTRFIPREMVLASSDPTTVAQQTARDLARAAIASSAETVEFGRVDATGEWVQDIPGETWPQIREDAEGDFLREVREQIDEGPYSEGRYRIQVRTPRGEQLLEEWTKTDSSAEEAQADEEGEEAPPPEAATETPGADLGAGPVMSPPSSEPSPAGGQATMAVAVAAVGAWRSRLDAAGRFRPDRDGVAYTRVARRRRAR